MDTATMIRQLEEVTGFDLSTATSVADSTAVTPPVEVEADPAPVVTAADVDWSVYGLTWARDYIVDRGWVYIHSDTYPEGQARLLELGWTREPHSSGHIYHRPAVQPAPADPPPADALDEPAPVEEEGDELTTDWDALGGNRNGATTLIRSRQPVWLVMRPNGGTNQEEIFNRLLRLGWHIEQDDRERDYTVRMAPGPARPGRELTTNVEAGTPYSRIDWRSLSNSSGTELIQLGRGAWLWHHTDQRAIDILQNLFGWIVGMEDTDSVQLAPPDGFDYGTAVAAQPAPPVAQPALPEGAVRFSEVSWAELRLGGSLIQHLEGGQNVWLSSTKHERAITMAQRFGWRITRTDRRDGTVLLEAPEGWNPLTAIALPATANLTGPYRVNGRFVSRDEYIAHLTGQPSEKAKMAAYNEVITSGTPEARAEAINAMARELTGKYKKTHQVWIAIDQDGFSAYLDRSYTGQGVRQVGQVIDVATRPINMCRAGTLGGRFILEAHRRNNGTRFTRFARVQLFGEMPSSFTVRKGIVLGIVDKKELEDFIKPKASELLERPAPMSLVDIYTRIKSQQIPQDITRDSRVDYGTAAQMEQYDSWIELVGYIDRNEPIPDKLVYKAFAFTRISGLANWIGITSNARPVTWFTQVEGNRAALEINQAGIAEAIREVAKGFDESQQEYERKVRQANASPFDGGYTAQNLEKKAREFFASKFPGITIKDAGFKS